MPQTINLRKFCQTYDGGYQTVLPAEALAFLIKSETDGKITHYQFKKILVRWLDLMGNVGLNADGKPCATLKENWKELATKEFS